MCMHSFVRSFRHSFHHSFHHPSIHPSINPFIHWRGLCAELLHVLAPSPPQHHARSHHLWFHHSLQATSWCSWCTMRWTPPRRETRCTRRSWRPSGCWTRRTSRYDGTRPWQSDRMEEVQAARSPDDAWSHPAPTARSFSPSLPPPPPAGLCGTAAPRDAVAHAVHHAAHPRRRPASRHFLQPRCVAGSSVGGQLGRRRKLPAAAAAAGVLHPPRPCNPRAHPPSGSPCLRTAPRAPPQTRPRCGDAPRCMWREASTAGGTRVRPGGGPWGEPALMRWARAAYWRMPCAVCCVLRCDFRPLGSCPRVECGLRRCAAARLPARVLTHGSRPPAGSPRSPPAPFAHLPPAACVPPRAAKFGPVQMQSVIAGGIGWLRATVQVGRGRRVGQGRAGAGPWPASPPAASRHAWVFTTGRAQAAQGPAWTYTRLLTSACLSAPFAGARRRARGGHCLPGQQRDPRECAGFKVCGCFASDRVVRYKQFWS